MSNTVNNGIPFVPENTIDPAAGLNESLLTVDALLQLAVVSVGDNAPPGSPANGARYVVGTAPTGAWAGRANQVAQWLDGAWRFYAARYVLNLADGLMYVRQGATWGVAAAEWTAETVSQAEAEAGTATTRGAWTAERVRQAILGWWNGATSAFGRGFVAAADQAAGRTALGLVAAATEATPNTLAQRDSAGSLRAFETVQTGAQIRAYPGTSPEIRTFKSVAAWNSNANPATGTIKITLPFSWTESMLIISISGFNYALNSSWSLLLSGFNFSSGRWFNCSASTHGSPPPFTSVSFGHDGTRCCILLGVTTTSMVYPKIVIDRVVVTNSASDRAWGQGWSIEQITSEAGITVTATPAIFGLTASPNVLATFTLATLPSAAANQRLQVYCSNLAGQPAPVYSDGTNWRRVSDNTIAN